VDVPAVKTGTVSAALLALLVKTGIPLPEHVGVQLAKIGMELLVSHVLAEDNGTPFQDNVHALTATGMDSHAFNAPLAKDGTHQVFHAHALTTPSGMASIVEYVQVQADSGIISLTIVSAELETGTVLNVSFALPTPIGMEELA
jgi:hypothetical protein